MTSDSLLEQRTLRLAGIREDISSRLWPIMTGMSSGDFNMLMDGMALLQYNCEARVSAGYRESERREGLPDRRLTTLPNKLLL